MDVEKKIELLTEMLEVDEGTIKPETKLADIEEWDSIAKLSIIVLMDEEFGKALKGDELNHFATVQDILDYMD